MLSDEDCVVYGRNYWGDALGTDMYGETDTALACQRKCRKTSGCNWFNWDNAGKCWLYEKRNIKPSYDMADGATGPGFCTGIYNKVYTRVWIDFQIKVGLS